ncbi:prolyl oligopeptidase family serine peptidase [Pseudoalteromonas sp. T1lg65]|uniref:prolyl oligopeptidase family serine peptidase n=1 Tax=Pseudoalteromonas sp. T1lg65 TaxID=2077101 RepID=UPI003F79387A
MKRISLSIAAVILASACSTSTKSPTENPFSPLATVKKQPVNETIFGKQISDPYRWMENDEETVRKWMSNASTQTDTTLTNLPGYSALYEELLTQKTRGDVTHSLITFDGRAFHLTQKAQDDIAKLYIQDGEEDRILVDPNDYRLKPENIAAIHNFSLSPEGKTLAFHVSQNGTEIGKMYFLDVASGKLLDHSLPDIWGEFPVVWVDENNFYATVMSYIDPNDSLIGLQSISYHLPSKKLTIEVGPNAESKSAPKLAPSEGAIMYADSESEWQLIASSAARLNQRQLVKKASDTDWVQVADYPEHVISSSLINGNLYMVSQKNAPNGQLLKLDLNVSQSFDDAEVLIKETDRLIHTVIASKNNLYVKYSENGVEGLYELKNNKIATITLPEQGVITDLTIDPITSNPSFALESPKKASRYYYLNNGKVVANRFSTPSVEAPIGFKVSRESALSADGTEVPITIYQSAKSEGKTVPALIWAYGSYGYSLRPTFNPNMFPFLNRGAIWIDCHVRGGGEKGQSWHVDGKGPNKPNGHSDLIACAEHLVKTGRSKPGMIGGYSGSMGGTLIGPAVLKRPDILSHAVVTVAILNPLRILHAQNGENQISEIGDPRTKAGFEALWAMDSYEQLNHAQRYPDIMLDVGLHDKRVSIWHSGKFAARYTEKGRGGVIAIRADAKSGHGLGGGTVSQKAKKYADIFAFMLNRSGHPEFQAK